MFWLWIAIAVIVVFGLSIWAGKALSGPKSKLSEHRQSHVTALKASGALRHRKSNQD